MLELPESYVIAKQLSKTATGKRITEAQANASPHKMAWYYGEPSEYDMRLSGRTIEAADYYGGRVSIKAEGMTLDCMDGVNLRYIEPNQEIPAKHQLLLKLSDNSALVGTVAMYGGIMAFPDGAMDDDFYFKAGRELPSPLSDEFNYDYFLSLFDENTPKLSAKAFLATKQRIPGLGNGVLQDILFNAKIHPRAKIRDLNDERIKDMYNAVKLTLLDMAQKGGRDTERDLFGQYGGYATVLSKKTKDKLCSVCGSYIIRQAYLGGNVYFCPTCQNI